MNFPRRAFLRLAAGAAALPAVPRISRAQAYPSRPVRIVVGFAAGGATDIQARLMGQWLSDRLGQQFIIENRSGASGNIGTEAVAKAPADGYTLLQIVTPHAINAALYTNLNFDFMRDIAPVICAARLAYVVVVHPSLPVKTVRELVARIYASYPSEVHDLAARTVTAHLLKLEHDGAVHKNGRGASQTWARQEPTACARCGRPVRGRGRYCGSCSLALLQGEAAGPA